MSNDEIILDPVLRRSATRGREYWCRVLGDAEYKRIVDNTDRSHIYTYGGWPLKVELFKERKKKENEYLSESIDKIVRDFDYRRS